MKKIISLFLLLGIIFTGAWASDNATDFHVKGQASRPSGMGGAFVAVSDDVSAPLWNPAGLSLLPSSEILALYSKLPDFDMATNYVGFAIPLRWGTFGLSWLNSTISGIPKTSTDPVTGRPILEGEFKDIEEAFLLTYANKLSNRLFFGVNLKQLSQKFTTVNYSASGTGADLGFLYSFSEQFKIGLTAQNILKPKLRQDTIPTNYKFGLAYKLLNDKLLLATDIDINTDKNLKKPKYHFGTEYNIREMLFLRAGLVTGREGEKDQVAAGIGIRLKNLQVDYAYTPHKDLGNTQIVSLIWRFTKKSDKNKAIVSVANDKEKEAEPESSKVGNEVAEINAIFPQQNENGIIELKQCEKVQLGATIKPADHAGNYKIVREATMLVEGASKAGEIAASFDMYTEGRKEITLVVYDKDNPEKVLAEKILAFDIKLPKDGKIFCGGSTKETTPSEEIATVPETDTSNTVNKKKTKIKVPHYKKTEVWKNVDGLSVNVKRPNGKISRVLAFYKNGNLMIAVRELSKAINATYKEANLQGYTRIKISTKTNTLILDVYPDKIITSLGDGIKHALNPAPYKEGNMILVPLRKVFNILGVGLNFLP